MSSGRYSKTRAKPKKKDEDTWYPPAMWSDSRYKIIRAAIDSLDEVARKLEQRWGIGKLERIAPPALSVKFEQARQNFNDACHGDDHNYLVQKADNLITGWKALERYAEKNGHQPSDERIWYAIAPDDAGGKPFAIIQDGSVAKLVDPESVTRTYTLDEVCRFIKFWEEKNSLANAVKDTFHGSEITAIKKRGKKDDKKEEAFFDDEIPF